MVIKYPPRKAWNTHSPNCWCDRCFKNKTQGKKTKELDYFDYIRSSKWEDRKRRYFKHHRKICAACGSKYIVQLHHLRYGDFGNEPDYALVALCEVCHKDFHKRYGGTSKDMIKATNLYIQTKQEAIKSLLRVELSIDGKSV